MSILRYVLSRFGKDLGSSEAGDQLTTAGVPDVRLRRRINLPVGWSQSASSKASEGQPLDALDFAGETTERLEDLMERVKRLHALLETSRAHSEQAIQKLQGMSRQLHDLEVRVDQLSEHIQPKTGVVASREETSASLRRAEIRKPPKKPATGDDALDSFSDEASQAEALAAAQARGRLPR